MATDTAPATNAAITTYAHTTGYADTTGYCSICANSCVMADLHLVINLDAFFYYGVAQCTAVDGCIGANLDIIPDNDTAQLWNPEPTTVILFCDAEAICSYYGTRVYDDTITKHYAVTQRYRT